MTKKKGKQQKPKEVNKVQQVIDLKKDIKSDNKRAYEYQKWVKEVQVSIRQHIEKLEPTKERIVEIATDLHESERDRSEIKSYGKDAPEGVRLVMAAVMVIFSQRSDWRNAKAITSQP